ncbi:MAG: nuclear transport factor 2 family protein [Chloroflexi bacterium]|nr:nuclear transport factor 2 family protein [Chloroflexota bacterium]
METSVRDVLQRLQDGYVTRNVAQLGEFMQLFLPQDDIEMIGIGAAVRDGYEWFQGVQAVREIIESDWTHWGDVTLDIAGAKITVHNETAWLSTSGALTQTDTFEKALPFYLEQMKDLLVAENQTPAENLMEATHFGLRRLRERQLGVGHKWPLVLTAVLIKIDRGWQFHTLHWSMPVD